MESLWYSFTEWFRDWLAFFGLLHKEANLMLIGLDFAGKTTLLGMLKMGRLKAVNPTFHAIKEELIIESIKFTCFDLGGHPEVRRIWRDYYPTTSAIVFVVDASDHSRIDEAKDELQGILKNEDIKEIPVLILGNKIDAPSAMSEEELKIRLGLVQSTTGKDADPVSIKQRHIRPIEVFMCSIVQRHGFGEGFRWLSQYL
mmetsp:Transcript_7005/g.9681  ORF Transcript_7005/g.9681 Transcript_7005/m.9681 type:complete len:200 (+) Transcript_7005:253-852(+)